MSCMTRTRVATAALVLVGATLLAGCGSNDRTHQYDFTSELNTRDTLDLAANVQAGTTADLCVRWADDEGQAFAWLEDEFAADFDRGVVEAWVGEHC